MKEPSKKELYTEYFSELRVKIHTKNLITPSPRYGMVNIVVFISLYILWLIFLPEMGIFLAIIVFSLLTIELGFISHDLIHNQYFRSPRLNQFFSSITANLLIWLSHSWWMKKHNVEHHTFTNSDIHDTDIRDYDEIFTKNPWKSPFFHKHKHILFWISTSALYFNLIFLSYKHILKNKRYGELVLNLLSIGLLPSFLLFYFGLLTGILALALIYILVWIHLAFVFMTNHIWMEVIDGSKIKEYTWLDLQTRTSRNIRGWSIIHHVFGWLNKQIEHHLFPQVSRWDMPKVAQEVKSFCKEKWIPYHEVTFREALTEIYHTLKTWETTKVI